ncbi:MAG: alanine dehydrogenase [Proteobacteria bacterium]|nr:alanine dehydrogenase [Pseudomonadota bacterium]
MKIGIPKEVKNREHRVGLVPSNVRSLTEAGHQVYVEAGAGKGVGIEDVEYEGAGGHIISGADELWQRSSLIVKVKEPVQEEYHRLREGLIVYAFFHLAAEEELTKVLLDKKVTAVAYETIQLQDGTLPLLRPMSEVSGRLAPQIGAHLLEKHSSEGGKGILLGGVSGVKQGHVVIIGGGVVGLNAAKVACGLGARVTVLDINPQRLSYFSDIFGSRCQVLMSHEGSIAEILPSADLLISGVLVTGAKSPMLVSRSMLATMSPGSVVVDVAIDQGGSVETIHPTTHDNPTYKVDKVIHYGVTNIPGCVPKTSTYALTNVTFYYGLLIANMGLMEAVKQYPVLRTGLNTHDGHVTNKAVADSFALPYVDKIFQ